VLVARQLRANSGHSPVVDGRSRCLDVRRLDVRHTTSSAFKRVKAGQVLKSRRHSREPHDL